MRPAMSSGLSPSVRRFLPRRRFPLRCPVFSRGAALPSTLRHTAVPEHKPQKFGSGASTRERRSPSKYTLCPAFQLPHRLRQRLIFPVFTGYEGGSDLAHDIRQKLADICARRWASPRNTSGQIGKSLLFAAETGSKKGTPADKSLRGLSQARRARRR